MKKRIALLVILFLVIILAIGMFLKTNLRQLEKVEKENQDYEKYLGQTIFGTEVITVINKVTNENLKNQIPKDEKGFFIENDTNSIKIELKMLNQGQEVTYSMETIQKVGTNAFIQNFNLIYFQCTDIQYHEKTKKISKIRFEQIEE